MKSWGIHLSLLFALCVAVSGDGHWDYHENGPSTWGETYPTCDGNIQSPVMLNIEEAAPSLLRADGVTITLLDYDTAASGVFSNNGHSVNLAFDFTDTAAKPRVEIASPNANGTYYLDALHFHWHSEHWVDHESYPLEMHMVHTDPETGRNLVIGYVFIACQRSMWRWFTRSSIGLDAVAGAVRQLTEVGNSVNIASFAARSLMPNSLRACGYFHYTGSLTTPPCTEGVSWLVREIPMCVDEWQLEAFYSVLDSEGRLMAGNARPLQPLNNREVLFLTC